MALTVGTTNTATGTGTSAACVQVDSERDFEAIEDDEKGR